MAEYSGFFNAVDEENPDKIYDAEDFSRVFAMFISSGVFISPADNLMITSSGGLSVNVKAGTAFIDGYWYILDEDMKIQLTPNTETSTSITKIVCRYDKQDKRIRTIQKAQVLSGLPINNEEEHELVLATISIPVGASSITDANITDRRPYKQYCGYVSNILQDIDTTPIFAQFQAMFSEWFEGVKGQLSGDIAGNLQNQINDIVNNTPVIRYGASDPDNAVGKEGDIYIKIAE